MRVLLIDNYDSFAFNLVQALRVLGAEVLVRRNDALDVAGALALGPGAIVLSPGPKGPADAGISVPLVVAASERALPLMGVCLGHQAIVTAFGGTVERASRIVHGKVSSVLHAADALYADVPSPFVAMRYHSLVAVAPLPADLEVTAWTDPFAAGAPEIMGVRHRHLPIFGVQFHPESYRTAAGATILQNFMSLAERSKGRPE